MNNEDVKNFLRATESIGNKICSAIEPYKADADNIKDLFSRIEEFVKHSSRDKEEIGEELSLKEMLVKLDEFDIASLNVLPKNHRIK